mgnify:CR=1 FL=1
MDPVSSIVIDDFLKGNWPAFSKHCNDQKALTGKDTEEVYSEFERYLPMCLDIKTHLENEYE